MLRAVDSDLWVHEEPLRFLGFEIGRTMTVLRLGSGELFVHSPAKLTDELREELASLGEVRFVVPASKLHGHLYMEQYRAAFPRVELLAAPGLPARRTDLAFDGLLGSVPDPRWATDVDQVAIMGNWWLTELAFYHRRSRTLLLGDVGYHVGPEMPFKTRLMGRALGMYGRLGMPLDFRLTIRNERTFRRSLRSILAWDFDRIVPGHGTIIETGGADVFRDSYASYLRGSGR